MKKKLWEAFCIVNNIRPTDTVTAGQIFDFLTFCGKKHDEINEESNRKEADKE